MRPFRVGALAGVARGCRITGTLGRVTADGDRIAKIGESITALGDPITVIGDAITAFGDAITAFGNPITGIGECAIPDGDGLAAGGHRACVPADAGREIDARTTASRVVRSAAEPAATLGTRLATAWPGRRPGGHGDGLRDGGSSGGGGRGFAPCGRPVRVRGGTTRCSGRALVIFQPSRPCAHEHESYHKPIMAATKTKAKSKTNKTPARATKAGGKKLRVSQSALVREFTVALDGARKKLPPGEPSFGSGGPAPPVDFLEAVAVALDTSPQLRGQASASPDEIREFIAFSAAWEGGAQAAEDLGRHIRGLIAARRRHVAEGALDAYNLAKALAESARDKGDLDVQVRRMKQALPRTTVKKAPKQG